MFSLRIKSPADQHYFPKTVLVTPQMKHELEYAEHSKTSHQSSQTLRCRAPVYLVAI